MVDGLKFTTPIPDFQNWQGKTSLDFYSKVNDSTGEIKTRKYEDGSQTFKRSGKLDSVYYLELIEKNIGAESSFRLNARGSVHKGAIGNNYDRLSWSALQEQIDSLSGALNINPNKLKIQNIEIGLPINLAEPVKPMLDRSLVAFKGFPFNKYNDDNTGRSIGYYYQCSEYVLKLYDKSLQCNLKDCRNLLKVEKSVHKMRCIQAYNIHTMADLQDREKVFRLIESLDDSFDSLIIIDLGMILKISNSRDQLNLEKYLNPKFWQSIKTDRYKYRYHKENLKLLQAKYNDTLQIEIKNSITNEWATCFESQNIYHSLSPNVNHSLYQSVITEEKSTQPLIIPLKMNGENRSQVRKKRPRTKKAGSRVSWIKNGQYFNAKNG